MNGRPMRDQRGPLKNCWFQLHMMPTARPRRSWTGRVPKKRASRLSSRLSPMRKTSPSGTVIGPNVRNAGRSGRTRTRGALPPRISVPRRIGKMRRKEVGLAAAPVEEAGKPAGAKDNVESLLRVEPLAIEVGLGLIGLVDRKSVV